MVTEFLSA